MNDHDFFTHRGIPQSIKMFDSDVKQLAVGKSGKNGVLRLVLQNDDSDKTVIRDQFSEVPLHAQRVLHYDDSCPKMAHLYIVSASGGILQGDRYKIDITVKMDTMTHVTTQGATRVYSMNSNSAMQVVNITLEEGAYMEFIPDQIIPYRNSRFYQETNLNVHDSATLVYSEIITPGRVAMGELFEYDVCYIKTWATNQEKILRFIDTANLEPKRQRLTTFGILGDYTIIGSVYILTKRDIWGLSKVISDVISANGKISGGISTMKDNCGLLVRILSNETEVVKNTVLEIVRHVRQASIGADFCGIRKN